MKRLLILVISLFILVSSVSCIAEEKAETGVMYTLYVEHYKPDDGDPIYGYVEFLGNLTEPKQPLIFQDTPENPKTGFSRILPEEIAQLQETPFTNKPVNSDSNDVYIVNTQVKKALLELEKLFTYEVMEDGTIERKFNVEQFKKEYIMHYPKRDIANCLDLHVLWYEEPLLYEQLATFFIDQLVPHIKIKILTKGSSFDKLSAIYSALSVNTKKGTYLIPSRVSYWTTKKSAKQIKRDQEYVTQLLLNITKEEFHDVYSCLNEIFCYYTYKLRDDYAAYIIK